jgi:hypothetical protein
LQEFILRHPRQRLSFGDASLAILNHLVASAFEALHVEGAEMGLLWVRFNGVNPEQIKLR